MSKRLDNAAKKFQRDMQKLGLGVTISVPGRESVTVTTWCESCNYVSTGPTCAKCGKSLVESASSRQSETGEA